MALLLSTLQGILSLQEAIEAWVGGVRAMMIAMVILVLAWSLGTVTQDLGTAQYLAQLLQGAVPLAMLPVLVFVVAGAMAFATGTSWATMAILIPTAVPVAFHVEGGNYGPVTILTIAAVLDGAIFGDHCSPISDTTIMSSAASGCDHLAHVRTQIPYSLFVAATALIIGYLPAAMGIPQWLGILGVVAVGASLFLALWFLRRHDTE